MNRLFDVGEFLDGFSGVGRRRTPEEFFSKKRRAGWHKGDGASVTEPRCCLDQPKPHMVLRGITCHAQWQRSVLGPTLTEIKSDAEYASVMADGVHSLVARLLGDRLGDCGWAVVTPPARRHLTENFAQRTGRILADRLGIPYYPDVAAPPRTRQRIAIEYEPLNVPEEMNLIVFDDIVTTGSTLWSMDRLIWRLGRTAFNVVGIDNH